MKAGELPLPDTSLAHADTRPLTGKHSAWPGHVEVAYTCGHIVLLKESDEIPSGCVHESHSPPPVLVPTPLTVLAPDTSVAADTRPLGTRQGWPGHIEVVYACGHWACFRLADDIPASCADVSHQPLPATPAVLPHGLPVTD